MPFLPVFTLEMAYQEQTSGKREIYVSLGNLRADSLLDKLWSGGLKKICSPLILSAKF